MIELYEKISRINPNYRNQVFTVIEGDQIGKKALFSNGKLVWETEDRGFFPVTKKQFQGLISAVWPIWRGIVFTVRYSETRKKL